MWAFRSTALVAAVCGNFTHVYLGALTLGGWQEFIRQFKRGYELTACFDCHVQNDIFMYIVWAGGPFYLLAIATFTTRSTAVLVTTLLSIVGLVGLDLMLYFGGNSKDWYVTLAPLILGPISFVGLVLLLLAGRASRSGRANETPQAPT